MIRTSLLCALATTAACSFGDDRPLGSPGDADAGPDGKPDGQPSTETGHLLITEVKNSGNDNEYVEIWNPTDRTIDLRNYYLTDVGDYWKYPSAPATQPEVSPSDFIVRFPQGAVMVPDQVITVATSDTAFEGEYRQVASYGINVTAPGALMLDRVRVPGQPGDASITDTAGEVVVLFYWDGGSDLVKDVDIVVAGTAPTDGNSLKAKEPVDGPDVDTTATAFKTESMQLGVMAMRAEGANSYKRIKLENGNERQNTNGNGITGDDETSEMLPMTWDGGSPTAATPGVIPVGLKQR
jgi:Lamin Tail Domain